MALLGILFAAVLPAHAQMRAGSGTIQIELCTPGGLQQVAVPDPAGGPEDSHTDRGAGPCLGCAAAPGPLLAATLLSVWLAIEQPAEPAPIDPSARGIASLLVQRLPATGPPHSA